MKRRSMRLTTAWKTGLLVGLTVGPLWLVGSPPTAVGAEVFTVDPSQSRVSISGNVLGSPLREQGPCSLTTEYGGSLLAEVGGNTIRFPGQSQVVAFDSGDWEPMADGSDGAELANYGGAANRFFTTGVAALRQIQLDVTSDVLAIADGQFDSQALTFSFPADAPSSLAYRTEGAYRSSGVFALAGRSATGMQTQASLMTVGDQQLLIIPINYDLYFSLLTPNDTTITLTGQLVAIRK